jgi:hypothetical protein
MRRLPLRPMLGAALLAVSLSAGAALASPLATIAGKKGTFDVSVVPGADSTQKGRIYISYRPDSTKVTCNPIYLVQTIKMVDQNGNKIDPKTVDTGVFAHMQDDATPVGTSVDHLVCEKDPYYNGEDAGKDSTSAGSSSASSSAPTAMSDAPFVRKTSFPPGVTKITFQFEVCAVCKADGKVLDCVTWTYTRSLTDNNTGTITPGTAAVDTASAEFKAALAGYKSNHKDGTVCPEQVAETAPGGRNVKPGEKSKSPYDPPVSGQPSVVQWSLVNTSTQDVMGVTWTVMLDGLPLTWGVVPFIGWFDFATVDFPLPALPAGPHMLTMMVDSDYLISEYDESDNFAMDEFLVRPATGVGPGTPAARLGITSLLPNPTRGRVAATLSLPDAGRATLELVDLSGRRIREFAVAGAGVHTLHLELGRDTGSGLYLLRLRQGGQEAVRKLTIVR